ncbi:MAG TPA: hypothetical protein VMH90_04870 [Thermoplasmata archaeon]|nr:hypothetical protein [Thermoplasmata archaeon]
MGTVDSPTRAALGEMATASPGHVATAWVQVTPPTSPSSRDQVQMGYDVRLKEVVLFGGYDPAVVPLGDTWVFHAGVWTNLTPNLTVSPPARWGAGFAYDPQQPAGMILFGGRNTTQFFNDTWLFNGTAWFNLTSGPAPSPRGAGVGLAYDAPDHALVLHGGGTGNVPSGSFSPWTRYNDTWAFVHGHWANRTRAAGPGPGSRSGMVAVYDPVLRGVLYFGGILQYPNGTTATMQDTWSFVHGVWKLLATRGSPPALYAPAITWDPTLKGAILFGENTSSGFDPTYEYRAGAWRNVSPVITASPATRGNVGLTFDKADGYLVLFGGDTPPPNYSYRSDTWAFV